MKWVNSDSQNGHEDSTINIVVDYYFYYYGRQQRRQQTCEARAELLVKSQRMFERCSRLVSTDALVPVPDTATSTSSPSPTNDISDTDISSYLHHQQLRFNCCFPGESGLASSLVLFLHFFGTTTTIRLTHHYPGRTR